MTQDTLISRLAVCSWSLQPPTSQDLIAKLKDIAISRVQLALDPLREVSDVWRQTAATFQQNDVQITSGMFGCVGEDYSSLDTIRVTGGIAPDHTWEQNLQNIKATALLARQLGLKLVTFHAGFVPHDVSDPNYSKMLNRLRTVADVFAAEAIELGLETGQETAPVLLHLLKAIERPNLGVNFDPANMILYDKGNPIEALRTLGPWVRQVHIKDAVRTKVPGTWGEEVPAGTGQVDWRAFFTTLRDNGFKGSFVIEREAGNDRVGDIKKARQMVQNLSN
jgi:sugar phosphate isomerase/epimerase